MTALTGFLLTITVAIKVVAAEDCFECHKDIVVAGAHKNQTCTSCHKQNLDHCSSSAILTGSADSVTCFECHPEYKNMINNTMVTRKREKVIVDQAFSKVDRNFFDKNCNGCHVKNCTDCHSQSNDVHNITLPENDKCFTCHREYYIGLDYKGMALREDHERYQRGIKDRNDYYLKMLPDVHYEKGLKCRDCHSMGSLAEGKKSSAACIDCHEELDMTIVEHSIKPHMKKLECYTCHSAWTAQEYGTFFIQIIDSSVRKYYRWIKQISEEYVKSSFLKEYNHSPIGLNDKGLYSPIRPEFIFFHTKIVNNQILGKENKMIGANWKALFPHTIRKESVSCDSCHDNRKRYILLDDETDIYNIGKDNIDELDSFYSSQGQKVINGKFVNNETYTKIISRKSKLYILKYIEKWKKIESLLEGSEEN